MSNPNPFLILIVGLMPTLMVESMRFELQSGIKKCISEDMRKKAMTIGRFNVVTVNEGHTLRDIEKISVSVTSPTGLTYYNVEHVEFGNFAFTAHEAGDYNTCFLLPENQNPITVSVNFDWKTGVISTEWSNVATKGQVETVDIELRKLFDTVSAIHEEMFYLREREAEMQQLNRSTNSKMATLGLLSILVSLSVAGLQLWHLKGFFEREKLL